MSILMLCGSMLLLLSGSLLSPVSAKHDSKTNPKDSKTHSKDSKTHSKQILYSGEGGYQPENNSIYGGPNSDNSYGDQSGFNPYGGQSGFNPYGGIPNNNGGFIGSRDILRNRFPGRDSSSQDENQGSSNDSDQSTGGNTYPYSGSNGQNEIANGVFSNPFLGHRTRTSGLPSGYEPNYGSTGSGAEPGYGRGSYLGGRFNPNYGVLPGIYSSSSGNRPGAGQGFIIYPADQGYEYPLRGIGNGGTGLRQPSYGYDPRNEYGSYPGILRNIPSTYVPSDGGSGIYRESPRSYGPALFGYERNPQFLYPGLGFEYGRLNESRPQGNRADGSGTPKAAELPQSQVTPSADPPKQSEQKTKSLRKLRKEDP